MLIGALLLFAVTAAFLAGFAIAARVARRRLHAHARRAAAANDALERQLIKLGAGLGIGA
ncbi:MAG: hypothetical protein U1F37_19360 [Alphaproteobacteria bacterium]|nr:hypothetical protein [Candidatus Odyssella sp.]